MPIATPPPDFDPTLAPAGLGLPTDAEARATGFEALADSPIAVDEPNAALAPMRVRLQ